MRNVDKWRLRPVAPFNLALVICNAERACCLNLSRSRACPSSGFSVQAIHTSLTSRSWNRSAAVKKTGDVIPMLVGHH